MNSVSRSCPGRTYLQPALQQKSQPEEITHRNRQPLEQQEASAPKSLTDLPNELLGQICCATQLDAVPNLRLVSKRFAVIAARDLFEEVYVTYFHFESVAKLEAISNDKTVRRHVKYLVCQGDWLTAGDKSDHVGCENPIHRILLDGRQMDILRTKDILLAAVDRLDSLQAVTLTLGLSRRENDIFDEPCQWSYCQKLRELVHTRAPAQLNLLLPHLQATKVPCTRLCLGTLNFMKPETVSNLRHLRELDLALPSRKSLGHPSDLSKMLSSVPELRGLYLALGDSPKLWSLEDSIDEFSMPKLTSVTLENIHISDHKLLGFFSRHAKTLKIVQLANIGVVTHGTPTDLFEWMQRGLRLEQAYVTGEIRSESGKRMIIGSDFKKGQATKRFVEAYITKEEPCSFEMAGLEFGLTGMRFET